METIYARIRSKRQDLKLKQVDIADKLNLSQGSYARLERGETEITLERVKQIAEILNMSHFELIGFNQNEFESIDTVQAVAKIQYLEQRIAVLESQIENKDRVMDNESDELDKAEAKIKELEKKIRDKDAIVAKSDKICDDRLKDKDKMIEILERLLLSQSK